STSFGLNTVGSLRQIASSAISTLRLPAISAAAPRKSLSIASSVSDAGLRISTVKAISPGMTLREGAAITASPTVPTGFGPGAVAARQHILGGVIAGIGRRRHRRRRKARAFLVGPVDDADRGFRLDPGVIERADDLERCQRAEHAVELAAGRLGIEMRAQAHRRLRHVAAPAQAEHRSQRIDMHFEARGLARPAEPVAHLLV